MPWPTNRGRGEGFPEAGAVPGLDLGIGRIMAGAEAVAVVVLLLL